MKAFLSYAKDDEPEALKIAHALEKSGIDYWSPEKNIKPGDSFPSKIAEAIKSSDSVLVLLSPKSSKSPWVNREIAFAISDIYKGDRKRVIPVLLSKNVDIPFFLRDKQYVDLSDAEHRGAQIDYLIRAIQGVERDHDPVREQQLLQEMMKLDQGILTFRQVEEQHRRAAQQVQIVSSILSLLAAIVGTVLTTLAVRSEFLKFLSSFSVVFVATTASLLMAVLSPLIYRFLLKRVRLGQINES